MKLAESRVLSPEVCEVILGAIFKSQALQNAEHAVACAATIINFSEFEELPKSTFESLVALPSFEELLVGAAVHVDVTRTAAMTLNRLVSSVLDLGSGVEATCRLITSSLPLGDLVAGLVERALLRYSADPNHERRSNVAKIIHCCMESQHAVQCDNAIGCAIEQLEGSAKAAAFEVLAQTTLGATRHAPLAESGTTFLLALEHHNSAVRVQAVERAVTLSADSGGLNADLHAAVLRRLDDDAASVVLALARGGPSLLAACCPEVGHRVNRIGKALRAWSTGLWANPEVNGPVVRSLLAQMKAIAFGLQENEPYVRSAATMAFLEHFPSEEAVHNLVQLRPQAQDEILTLWMNVLSDAAELGAPASKYGCALFAHLQAPKLPKKGKPSLEAASSWSKSAAVALATALASPSGGGVAFGFKWSEIAGVSSDVAPSARVVLLNAMAHAVPWAQDQETLDGLVKTVAVALPEVGVLTPKVSGYLR